jgi:hypothetical protein
MEIGNGLAAAGAFQGRQGFGVQFGSDPAGPFVVGTVFIVPGMGSIPGMIRSFVLIPASPLPIAVPGFIVPVLFLSALI